MKRRIKIEWVVGLASLAVLFGVWLNGDINPKPNVPSPVMPKQNAFDAFQLAASKYYDNDTVDKALVPSDDLRGGLINGIKGMNAASVATVARRNQSVTATIRAGLNLPYQAPPIRTLLDSHPYFKKDRELARLLQFEGRAAANRGDWFGAENDDTDAIELGVKMMHGGNLYTSLVAEASSKTGRQDAWLGIGHLNRAQALHCVERLQVALADRESVDQTLQQDLWTTQAGIVAIMSKPDWYGSIDGHHGARWVVLTQVMQCFFPKHVTYRIVTDYLTRWIPLSRLPYPKMIRAKKPAMPSDPFSQIVLPSEQKYCVKDAAERTFTSELLVAFALRAYWMDHGYYPASLNLLVPRYLTTVPPDPFALSGPLRYHRTVGKYLLYSIGPDGIDDGGRSFVNRNTFDKKPSTSVVGEDTKGDILAEANKG